MKKKESLYLSSSIDLEGLELELANFDRRKFVLKEPTMKSSYRSEKLLYYLDFILTILPHLLV